MTDNNDTPESCACIGHPDGPCDLCIEYQCGATAERARIMRILNDAAGLEMPYEHLVDRDDLLDAIQKGNA